MRRIFRLRVVGLISVVCLALLFSACSFKQEQSTKYNPIKEYAQKDDPSYHYQLHKVIDGDGYKTHILRMVSGQWLTTEQVKNPEWWHWVKIVVPENLSSSSALLLISGGDREDLNPDDANGLIIAAAKKAGAVAVYLHNVPNQPIEFVGDNFGPREEDELIAYGWRQFMEEGAKKESVEWLARLPMTRAAVRAMDSVQDYAKKELGRDIDGFVVAGGSKRGWTTWTTAIADERVVAIAPIVIDLLNVGPSFLHHWRAYGEWSPAVEDYVNEGVMDWFGSKEFDALLDMVDPYSYRTMLTLPKMLINACDDEFFLNDSWQFYWNDLVGEKHIRYVPNTGHSLDETDAGETLIAYFNSIVKKAPRPDFDWKVENGEIHIKTDPAIPPQEIRLWSATNDTARDFRSYVVGKAWTSEVIPPSQNGEYVLKVNAPATGWTAFMGELTFKGPGGTPFKMTTGVVVTPDSLPCPEFQSPTPKGTRAE